MAESVCVGVRVRPFNDREKGLNAELCIDMDGPTTRIRDQSNGKETPFTFDESFWSHDGFVDDGTGYNEPAPGSKYADQRYVFDTFGQRVLNNAWDGFHCCLFAYGQTGAGKSYSMVGYGKNKGIVPISCEEIFIRIAKNDNPDKTYEVTVSMIEIYNETVQDLLILPEDRPKKGLEIRESKLLGIYIDGVLKRPVANYEAIESVIEEATSHRTVGSTLMNATSSRAHTVQTIEFKQVETVGGKQSVKISMVNLVDLAGSEKAGQTGATGDRLKEGAMINKSLSALGNVIEKLAEKSSGKGKVLIPYRDSKLTRLLQNALGGSSKTIMICALSPASSNYEETLSTLRYADRAKKIKNTAVVNENPQDRLIRELKEENAKLKELMDTLSAGGPIDAGAVTSMKEQQKEIEEVEKALSEMNKSFEQRVQEAKEREMEQKMKRRTTLGALMRSTVPQFVNLNEDPALTGRIKYNLEEGKVTRIGTHKEDSESSEDEDEDDDDEDDEASDAEADDSADDAGMDLKAKLDAMSEEELKEKAKEAGATDTELQGIAEAEEAKTAIIDLILSKQTKKKYSLKENLEASTIEELKQKAEDLDVTEEELDEAGQAEDPKTAFIDLITKYTPTQERRGSVKKARKEPSETDDSEDSEDLPDILLLSESIFPRHAYVTNQGGRCFLMSEGAPADSTWINGESVAELLRRQEQAKQEEELLNTIHEEDEDEEDADDAEGPGDKADAKKDDDEEANKESEGEAVEANESEAAEAGDLNKDIEGEESEAKQDAIEEPMARKSSEKLPDAEPEGILLQHGDRVIFGKCYFFFVIPTEGVAEMMIMCGQVDYTSAHKEVRRNRIKGQSMGWDRQHSEGVRAVMFAAARSMGSPAKGDAGGSDSDADSEASEGTAQMNVVALLGEKEQQLQNLQWQLAVAQETIHERDATINELQRLLHIALGGDGSAPGAPQLQWTGAGTGMPQKMSDALIRHGSLKASRVSFTQPGSRGSGSASPKASGSPSARLRMPPDMKLSPRSRVMVQAESANSGPGQFVPPQRGSGNSGAAAHQVPSAQALPALLGAVSRAAETGDSAAMGLMSSDGSVPSEPRPRSSYKAQGITHKIQKSFADAINVIDVVEATLTNLKDKQGKRKKTGKVAKAQG